MESRGDSSEARFLIPFRHCFGGGKHHGRAYSQDLRERVMAAVDSGTGAYAAAAIVRGSVSYISKVLGRRQTAGETRARPWAGGPKPKRAAFAEALSAWVASEPDAPLAERQAWLIAEHDGKVSIGGLWKRLRQLGLTLKKSHCAPPGKTARIAPEPAKNGLRVSPV
jgi:transposase